RDLVKKCAWLRMAGKDMVGGDQMIVLTMRKRTNERILIGARRQAGQMFTDNQARNLRGNWLEFSAQLGRRVRLHIESIEMAGGASQKNDDDRLGAMRISRTGAVRLFGCSSQRWQRRQAYPQKARITHLQELAAREADQVPMTGRGRNHVVF